MVQGSNPGGGERFSTPIHIGHESHPASYTMGTRSFPAVKWLGHGTDHPKPSSAKVKKRVELYMFFPSGPLQPVL